jgi:fatty acid desaturase
MAEVQIPVHEAGELPEAAAAVPASADKFTPPEYTMKQIYDAIPPHCFHSNTLLSLGYVLRDFAFALTLVLAATHIPGIPIPYLRHVAWFSYAFLQGLVFTGLWELAHECGHGALSKSKAFNNTVGLIIHSLLLVPYHSWRFTHSQHHKSTNNLDKDIAFVPTLKEDFDAERETHSKAWELVEDTPIVALVTLFFHQLIAFPIYLTINNFALERMAAAPWWKRSHFYLGGDGPNFRPENTKDVLISDVGIALAATGLCFAVRWFGVWNVMLFYGFPYLWTNHWIRRPPFPTC